MKRLFLLLCLLFTLTSLPAERVRKIDFSGFEWGVKSSEEKTAPGPNYFSDSPRSVWVDDKGLHLTVQKTGGLWQATEVYTTQKTGYGTYTFTVGSPLHRYEPQVVAGFFTWDPEPGEANREIDIEFSAWGVDQPTRMQYVVQPYQEDGRLYDFAPDLQGSMTTHRIQWTEEGVSFASYHGSVDPDAASSESMLIERWYYPDSPSEGNAHFRMNLWLFRGEELENQIHMVITSFSYSPLT